MTPETQATIKDIFEVVIIVASVLFTNEKVKPFIKKILSNLRPHHSHIKVNIQQMLDGLRSRTGAVRCAIWMLSNGQQALNGYSYKYANMIYESAGVGQKSLINTTNRIPVESFAEVLAAIQKSDWIFIGKPNSQYPILNAVYKQYGYSCATECKFVNSNVDMGFVSASWGNQTDPTEEQLKDIRETSALIYAEILKLK